MKKAITLSILTQFNKDCGYASATSARLISTILA